MFCRRLVSHGRSGRRDADGYFWFVGRADDVIKSSGHLIGPFEVESAADGASGGRRGRCDRQARSGRVRDVKAFVSLKPVATGRRPPTRVAGVCPHAAGAAVAPKEIEFSASCRGRARQDHAATAQSAGAGIAEGDSQLWSRHDRAAAARPRDRADRAHALHLLRQMLRIRRFEEKCAELYSAGKIRGFLHLYIGEEAVAVGAMRRSRPTMRWSPPIASTARRWRAGRQPTPSWPRCSASRKVAARAAAARCTSSTPGTRFYGGNAIVGGGLPLAVGLRWPTSCRVAPRVTACFFGDGAVAEGEFHEALNLAALWKLPVLFLCENNLYAMGTRSSAL